jgi:peptidoglycan/LPS O-acetylase OafA/YrhL
MSKLVEDHFTGLTNRSAPCEMAVTPTEAESTSGTAISNVMMPALDAVVSHPKYRADIDGLRAIAVLSVVVFHAFPGAFPGGFIGVDVFFVISGFLISTIIFSNLERGSFSFRKFYDRRITRIFPALLLVLSASLAFGWFALLPDEFAQLGKHMAGGAGFFSNFLLRGESGYFDNAAETKPLLHLWSLAIEEQFYLFWPLLLSFVHRRGWGFLGITASIAAVSFAANIHSVASDPIGAYYLPLPRFWELMLGGLLAGCVLDHAWIVDQYRTLQSWAGALLLVLGLIVIGQGRSFPGWWALLPTMGTVLVISGGQDAWFNQRVLANKCLVWFGLISYPLYLWHWPLLSFARVVDESALSPWIRLALIGSAVLLAWLTYRFVEQPLRSPGPANYRIPLLIGLLICTALVGTLARKNLFVARATDPGFLAVMRAPNEWEYLKSNPHSRLIGRDMFEIDSSKSEVTLFLGDSHMAQYAPRIGELIARDPAATNTAILVLGGGCPPIPGVSEDAPIHRGCADLLAEGRALIGRGDVKAVVIGAAWNTYFVEAVQPKRKADAAEDYDYYFASDGERHSFRSGTGADLALARLESFIKEIVKTKPVFLLLDNPYGANFDPHNFLSRNRWRRTSAAADISRTTDMDAVQMRLRHELIRLGKRSGAEIIDPYPELCEGQRCIRISDDGIPIYKDQSHLSALFVRDHADYIDRTLVSP